MVRLAFALTAALVIHILLLMAVLPEHRVVEPEVKGSGHVTVSIMRQQGPVPVVIEESAAEPELDDQLEEEITPEQEVIEQAPLPVPVPTPRKPESVKPITEQVEEKKVAGKIKPAEPVIEKVLTPVQDIPVSDDQSVFSAVESLRQPEALEAVNRPPVYPPLARKRGWQGTVLLEVDVLSDGMVMNVQVKKSSSFELLDKEALRAVRKWQFSPGFKAGKPAPMKVLVPVHFMLQDN